VTSLAPYDAVLVASYGGPDGPDAVLPFLRNATAGRGIPDARLAEVGAHYALFGGVSPINDRNAELVEALAAELAARGVRLPVVVGNRNWRPYVADALVELADGGAKRVLAVFTSAYGSSSGCRQYREDIERALAATGLDLVVDTVTPYAESAGFLAANAEALGEAWGAAGDGVRVLFVTHSIPLGMDAASGPGPEGLRYAATHRRVAGEVARLAGFDGDWELVFCSRSGPPQVPWLAPDVNDRIRELAASGVTDVVVAPIGFVNDHMEVVYDLDTEAAATASEVGVRLVRAATAGVRPAFVSGLVDALAARAARTRGEASDPEGRCGDGCCGTGRPRT